MSLLSDIFNEIESLKGSDAALLGGGIVHVAGGVPSVNEHILSCLNRDYENTVIIAEDEQKAFSILSDYSAFDKEVVYYPAIDPMFYKADIHGNFISEQRMEVIKDIYNGRKMTIVTTPQAFEDRLSSLDKIHEELIVIRKGESVDTEELYNKLVALGYENETQVQSHGEFAVRGNIIDIFPYTEDAPYRIDLFGDDIETIKFFDVESQRSIAEVREVKIFPGGDQILGDFYIEEEDRKKYTRDNEKKEGEVSFIDYFKDKKTLFVVYEPGKTLHGHEHLKDDLSDKNCLLLTMFDEDPTGFDIKKKYLINAKNIETYNGRFTDLANDLKQYEKKEQRILLYAASRSRAENLLKSLSEEGITASFLNEDEDSFAPGQIKIAAGALKTGFEYPDIKFSVISDVDIFGKKKAKRRKKKKYSGDPIKDFADLNIGDYVVHENHGIGIYCGIERINTGGTEKDYMKIEYAKNDCLYVLATDFDKLQKYAGSDAARPKINRIGSKDWANTKERVKKSVNDIAKELIKLYAIRESQNGYRYGEDTVWQKEFEEQFEFEETDDQLKAIEDVKNDMESGRIMDRLICGDVGFGKTEVAIRAAFKAVQEGKQVAFLVPTTVLAQQHFNTITRRMSGYPITVNMLSRFKGTAEQKQVVAELRNGMTDIVVGTHRLLSKDIAFKNLGLLVVDEEQRFGVTHKEKIKDLRKDVDVLTLSATPIPRTLYMSLSGIRDMSLLTEPPVDRVPIQTYVMEYSDAAVKEAILRETSRGGQVYYIYNRVGNIEQITANIRNLVPGLEVECAHGQMKAKELEDIMEEFIEGSINVLVSTTIVETGLDISNVNTIIVHDADNFGLSQLYQLRGRVGRSNRTAYAFLMYRKDKLIREVAEKRLKAIREFSDLGSGIRIAMRDLEIRGAGNLLGAEQSGHMEAVGYELYCKMLNHAVKMLKGEEIPEEYETTIDLDIDGFIPSEYIKNEFEKLGMYKKIAAVENMSDLEDIQEELLDRFGPVPKVVGNLLSVALIRAKGHESFVTEVSGKRSEFKVTMFEKAPVDIEKLVKLLKKNNETLRFVNEKRPYFIFSPAKTPVGVKGVQDALVEFFAILKTIMI